MTSKIQIVLNSDRCHVSVNGRPVVTFHYSNYSHKTDELNASHALHDAKAEVFNVLQENDKAGFKCVVDTNIVTK